MAVIGPCLEQGGIIFASSENVFKIATKMFGLEEVKSGSVLGSRMYRKKSLSGYSHISGIYAAAYHLSLHSMLYECTNTITQPLMNSDACKK